MKIIYYYQSLADFQPIINHADCVSAIYISAIHFWSDHTGPHINLNECRPSDPLYGDLWANAAKAQEAGIKIFLMVGGCGGAYKLLFENFDLYYPMLIQTIHQYKIQGIDLDVEEPVELANIQMLISRLRLDLGPEFVITMAPIAEAMQSDQPGLGGFIYKELFDSLAGLEINWFNIQSYSAFDAETYEQIVSNGYPPDKLVFGMISDQFSSDTFHLALDTVQQLKSAYVNFGGVFNWEYFDSPPDRSEPINWAVRMSAIQKKN